MNLDVKVIKIAVQRSSKSISTFERDDVEAGQCGAIVHVSRV